MNNHNHNGIVLVIQEATLSALSEAHDHLAAGQRPVISFSDTLEAAIHSISGLDKPILLLEYSLVENGTPDQLFTLFHGAKRPRVIVRLTGSESGKSEMLIRLGCAGIIQGSPSPELLDRVISAVSGGELWIDRKSLSRMLGSLLSHHNTPKFSRREADILILMRERLNNRQIAERLFISEDTVKWHLRNLYAKTKARDRRGLAHYAQTADAKRSH